ncbi:hypothetical protein CLOM_g4776 [Closterium sp. NIES-68]|nr:hypothetical protein CLOM_g4776 [Closterium sp. NIES-68]
MALTAAACIPSGSATAGPLGGPWRVLVPPPVAPPFPSIFVQILQLLFPIATHAMALTLAACHLAAALKTAAEPVAEQQQQQQQQQQQIRGSRAAA